MAALDDARWMTHALELAARGRLGTSPNPMVGAVLVSQAGELVGEGFHARFGGPHAEVEALAQAGSRAAGATLYVSLEPCNHQGKTPPCTDAVLAAGVNRVVVAMRDPNPTAAGGLSRLREHGVTVDLGPGREEARRLNRRWLRWVEQGRPWVTLKAGVSLDGRIASCTGESQWITGTAARRRGHELREEHDAILVGVNTVLADDPSLGRHLGLVPGRPWSRVILDSTLRTPVHARMLQEAPQEVVLVHGEEAPAERREALQAAGARLLAVARDGAGHLRITEVLARLAESKVAAVLVEGGAIVHGSIVDAGLADELVFFVAPMVLGGAAPPAVAGHGIARLADARRYRFEAVENHDVDLEIRAVRTEEADVHGID